MLKLYNTLTKRIEEFKPAHVDHVNMYTCGPTVYNFAHIGNLRSYIEADLLYRTLISDGFLVNWVMNITDIDDKTIKGAVEKYGPAATVENLREYTGQFVDAFLNDLDEINVARRDISFIRVTDVMPQIQNFIITLIDRGYAYKAEDGSTYFSIEKYQKDFGDYGRLVGEKFLEGKKIGARVKVDEYEKDNLSDFALWKAYNQKTDARIFWDHPVLGKGRPGWHVECSVINYIAFAGEPTDIHTGGVDLIFPHHTNEIAQSQPVYKPFVNSWCHCEHLQVDGKKMAKSLNNFYTLKDIKEKGFSGLDLRYFFLGAHCNTQQNFTWDGLVAAHHALQRYFMLAKDDSLNDSAFLDAADDNLNFPQALSVVWEQGKTNSRINKTLGLDREIEADQKVPDEVASLLEERLEARQEKDFKKSDEIRKQIENLGYEVMDTPDGQKVKKKLTV